ncbi:MAG: type III-B CRISPR module-associated Cmr3 family protein [Ferruginibacter sp.]
MSKSIQIILQPLDYYFFGTNETFNFGAKGIKNFTVKSNPFPQQTALLGVLRHALYTMGLPIGNSFDPEKEDQNFGLIEKISPLYLLNEENKVLFRAAWPSIKEEGSKVSTALDFAATGQAAIYNGCKSPGTFLSEKFDPKLEMEDTWMNLSKNGELVTGNDIFAEEQHIGIDKQKTISNRTDEGAFYRQQYYRLKKTAFAFEVTLNDEVDEKKLPSLLPFGGEKRMFSIRYNTGSFASWAFIAEQLNSLFRARLNNLGQDAVFLATDCYIADINQLESLLQFAAVKAKPFRNIITPSSVKNFSRLTDNDKIGDQLYKPQLTTYLLQQGGLLFPQPGKLAEVEKLLNQAAFQRIGYNYFITNN